MIPAPLAAGEVTLRAWTEDEAGTYLGLRDELVFRFTTESRQLGEAETRLRIAAARRDPDLARFAICDPDAHPVGNLAVTRAGDLAFLSYWLAPHGRGRGWASAALRAGTEWAFAHWTVPTAELEIDKANGASIRVAQAAGFSRYGTRLTSACGGPADIYRRHRHG